VIVNEIHPGVVRATVAGGEFAVLHAAVCDLSDRLPDYTEAGLLDELDRRAATVRDRLPRVVELVARLARHQGPGVLVLRLPAASLVGTGPTPVEHIPPGAPNLFSPDLYRGLLVGLAGWYGYGFTSQQRGVLHNNVIATRRLSDAAGHSASARHELGLHTEEASFALGSGPDADPAGEPDVSPDFFSLQFLRNPAGVPTVISMPDWARLSRRTLATLDEPWFVNPTSVAQGGLDSKVGRRMSIVYGPVDQPWVRLNTAGLNPEAYPTRQRDALVELLRHLAERSVDLALSPGDVAFIDNRRVLHGRPAYDGTSAPRYDGTDRWSRRLAASTDRGRIRRFESAPRVVDTERFLAAARLPLAARRA
jgi:Taurine catabolism dioxygenase TauD, TfdA family